VQYDAYYPARWGGEELHVADFDDFLPPEIVGLYKKKRNEIIARREKVLLESLEGLVRGVDYQICPRCKSCVGLEDGCNHMSCLCGGSFCFLCGEVAFDNGSWHWNEGGCPRYNAKGSGREQYDNEDSESVHEMYVALNAFFEDDDGSDEDEKDDGNDESEEDDSDDDLPMSEDDEPIVD
jgi:hypothetical protein